MKIYEFKLYVQYGSGAALVLAKSEEEAYAILRNYDKTKGWEFKCEVEHLSSTLKKPCVILCNSYCE